MKVRVKRYRKKKTASEGKQSLSQKQSEIKKAEAIFAEMIHQYLKSWQLPKPR